MLFRKLLLVMLVGSLLAACGSGGGGSGSDYVVSGMAEGFDMTGSMRASPASMGALEAA